MSVVYGILLFKATPPVCTLTLYALTCCCTMRAGLDAIFGAFLIGVILPRDEALVKVVEKIEDIVMVVFLPMVSQGFEVLDL